MNKRWIFLLCVILGCDQLTKESDETLPPNDTPPSYLSFRVEFPIKELEEGVNGVLPVLLFDDAVALKDASDTLFLKVKRKGDLVLSLKNNEVFAAIPLEVDAAITKKVMGITFSNQDAPISFSGTLRASAKVDLAENWELNLDCQYRNFHMDDIEDFSFMGISVNVEKAIQNAIDDHSRDLSNVICQAVSNSFNFREIVTKVYQDLQKPLVITRNPKMLYLYSSPNALNGQLIMDKRDTLSMHMEYRSNLSITPNIVNSEIRPLPARLKPLNTNNKLLLYPDVRIPYEDLSSLISKLLANQTFQYEDYTIQINQATVSPSGQRLQVTLEVSGDVEGVVKVSGVPVLNEDRSMSLSSFKYDLNLNDDLLNVADFVSHKFIEEYLSSQVQLDTKSFFDNLDHLIVSGLHRTPLGDKLQSDIKFDNIQTYQFRCTDDFLQWIFVVEGSAQLSLKNGLLEPK